LFRKSRQPLISSKFAYTLTGQCSLVFQETETIFQNTLETSFITAIKSH